MNIEAAAKLLDRGEWKHTWHLPRDAYGNIDWQHPETIAKVRDQIREARQDAAKLFGMCQAVNMEDMDLDNALMKQASQ